MISEFIINIIWAIVKPLIDLIPEVTLNVSTGTMSVFLDGLSAVFYLLPMSDILIMIGIIVSITVIKIVISLIKTIWDLLPIV